MIAALDSDTILLVLAIAGNGGGVVAFLRAHRQALARLDWNCAATSWVLQAVRGLARELGYRLPEGDPGDPPPAFRAP